MSIYTTQTVSREQAIRKLQEHAGTFEEFTNEELGNMLDDAFKERTLYNYIVEGPEVTPVRSATPTKKCPCCGYPDCDHHHELVPKTKTSSAPEVKDG